MYIKAVCACLLRSAAVCRRYWTATPALVRPAGCQANAATPSSPRTFLCNAQPPAGEEASNIQVHNVHCVGSPTNVAWSQTGQGGCPLCETFHAQPTLHTKASSCKLLRCMPDFSYKLLTSGITSCRVTDCQAAHTCRRQTSPPLLPRPPHPHPPHPLLSALLAPSSSPAPFWDPCWMPSMAQLSSTTTMCSLWILEAFIAA